MIDIISSKTTKIQAMYRQKVARSLFEKLRHARDVIYRNVRAFMIRRKWEKQIELMYGGYLKIVIRIQRVFRWRRRWGMILDYVDSRKKCAIRL